MKKFSRQLRYDIQTGTFLAWKEAVVLIIFHILIIFTMYPTMKANAEVKQVSLSWIDYLCGFFMGMHKFQAADRTVHFDIPIAWFFVQVGYYLTIAKYPLIDYRGRGYQFMIQQTILVVQ